MSRLEVLLPEDVKALFQECAREDHRTLSSWVRVRLTEAAVAQRRERAAVAIVDDTDQPQLTGSAS